MKTKPVLFCAALLAAGGALIAGVVLYNLLLVPRGITWRFGWIGPLMVGLALACFTWALWPGRGRKGWISLLVRGGISVVLVLSSLILWWNGDLFHTVYDLSPDGEHLLILTREEKTKVVTVERPYRIFWKREKEQLPGTVAGEMKCQWLENDICAVTWEDRDGRMQQYIATYGERGDGISYLDPRVPIMGSWTSQNPQERGGSEEWALTSQKGTVTITGDGQVWSYVSKDCRPYGTIALVLETDGTPEWSLAFSEDSRVDDNDLLAEGSSLILCRVSMEETKPVVLFATQEREALSEKSPDLTGQPDSGDEERTVVERMKAYRDQLPDAQTLWEKEGMMGIFYVTAASEDECLNVRNALKARAEMYRVNGVDNRVQLDSVRRLAGDSRDGLYEVTFTSLAISPGNQGASPEGESQQLTWRVRLMYADGGYLAAVFWGEEKGDWGLTGEPVEAELLSGEDPYHFFLSGRYDTSYMYNWRSTPAQAMENLWEKQLSKEYPDAVSGEFDGMPYMDLSGDGTLLLFYDGISEDLQEYCFRLEYSEEGGPSLYGKTTLVEEYRISMEKAG